MQLPDELLFALQFPPSRPSGSALSRLLNSPDLETLLRLGFASALGVDVNTVEVVYADDPSGLYFFPAPFAPIPGPNVGARQLQQLRGRGMQQTAAATLAAAATAEGTPSVAAMALASASASAANERGDIVVLGVTRIAGLGALPPGSHYSGLTEAQTVEDITTRLRLIFDAGLAVSPGLAGFVSAWGPSAAGIELVGVKAPLPGSAFEEAAGLGVGVSEQPASAAVGISEWAQIGGGTAGVLILVAVFVGACQRARRRGGRNPHAQEAHVEYFPHTTARH